MPDKRTGEKRVAYVQTNHGLVIEFQHSHIHPKKRIIRDGDDGKTKRMIFTAYFPMKLNLMPALRRYHVRLLLIQCGNIIGFN